MSCSRAVTSIDGTGYVVSPLDGVNGVRRNLLARIGLPVGTRHRIDARPAHFKAPKSVVFGPLPTTATSKVRKFTLRERARSLGIRPLGSKGPREGFEILPVIDTLASGKISFGTTGRSSG